MIILELVFSLVAGAEPPLPVELVEVREAERAWQAACNAFSEAIDPEEITALVHVETAALHALSQATRRAREAGYLVQWRPETLREIGRRSLTPVLGQIRTCEAR